MFHTFFYLFNTNYFNLNWTAITAFNQQKSVMSWILSQFLVADIIRINHLTEGWARRASEPDVLTLQYSPSSPSPSPPPSATPATNILYTASTGYKKTRICFLTNTQSKNKAFLFLSINTMSDVNMSNRYCEQRFLQFKCCDNCFVVEWKFLQGCPITNPPPTITTHPLWWTVIKFCFQDLPISSSWFTR